VPEYEVVWQMTGSLTVTAADDLTAKEITDALNHDEVVHNSTVQECRVLSTKEVP
jgi:hypothetical protein